MFLFFYITEVYLKCDSVSEQLIAPKHKECALKMGAISCEQKYLILIFFCLFSGFGEDAGK
jgi:hypothetical protein